MIYQIRDNVYKHFKALENYLITNESFYSDDLIALGKYINELEDKLSHRNMQIKELKKKFTTGLFSYDNVTNDWERLAQENQELKKALKEANKTIMKPLSTEL